MTGEPRYLITAAGVAVMIVAVAVGYARHESRAGDKAPVVSATPSVPFTPAPARSKPVEYAPSAAETIKGDGTWVIGREIKRGTYRTQGGLTCAWSRLQGGAGASWFAETPAYSFGPQVAVLGADDVVFASRGCGPWVMVR